MKIKRMLFIVAISMISINLIGYASFKYGTEKTTSLKSATSENVHEKTISQEGITYSIPSNWREVKSQGYTGYYLDDKGTSMFLATEKIDGISSKDYVNSVVSNLNKISSIKDIKTSTKTFAGINTDIIEYKGNSEGHILDEYQVVIFNNNIAYVFTLLESESISESSLTAFNNSLDTIKFK